MAIPTIGAFFLADAFGGRVGEARANLAMIVAGTLALALNRFAHDPRWGSRCALASTILLFTWVLYLGGAEGLGFVWFYFLPPPIFYLLGDREGWIWFSGSFALPVVVLGTDIGVAYSADLSVRFAVSYGLVGLLSYAMERSRATLLTRLDADKRDLEAALGEIRTLRATVPICAWCRRVRHDEGTWWRIEEYLDQQIGTRFSHGVCSDCAEEISEHEAEPGRA